MYVSKFTPSIRTDRPERRRTLRSAMPMLNQIGIRAEHLRKHDFLVYVAKSKTGTGRVFFKKKKKKKKKQKKNNNNNNKKKKKQQQLNRDWSGGFQKLNWDWPGGFQKLNWDWSDVFQKLNRDWSGGFQKLNRDWSGGFQRSRNVIELTFWHVCTAKTQISLRIHAFWSESS